MINGHLSLNNLDPQHAAQHRILFQNALGIVEKLATSAPTTDTLPDGYVQFAKISGKLYLYLNKNKTIYYQEFGGAIPSTFANINVQVFTSSGTFTKPSGITKVYVECVGGGGGGGGAKIAVGDMSGGGGGGGGYCNKICTITGDVSVTIGGGGAGGSGATPDAGADGGNSSFGSFCSANGGKGGQPNGAAKSLGGLGGTATGGDINVEGDDGYCGVLVVGYSGIGGKGGSSHLGGGGGVGDLGNGVNGNNYGGGAQGGGVHNTQANGGNGAGGVVIVRW